MTTTNPTDRDPSDHARLKELIERVTATSGPVASTLSASEWHELSEELSDFWNLPPQPVPEATPAAAPKTPAFYPIGTVTNFNELVRRIHADTFPLAQYDLDVEQILRSFATGGPWQLWTSNSYRRIGTERYDGNVISGCVQRDQQGDLTGVNLHADLMYAVAARSLLPRAMATIRLMRDQESVTAKEHHALVVRVAREHKVEIDRLRAELKIANDRIAEREVTLDRKTEAAVDVEADVHALQIVNQRLRKLYDDLVIALEAARER